MNLARKLAAVSLCLAAPLLADREVAACGGEFSPPTQDVEVASHRMILSIAQAQSTLYDEIAYTGSPASFAWVLPIKGQVTVGLSSDALLQEIDQVTAVTVSAPNVVCGCQCSGEDGSGGGSFGSGGDTGTGGGSGVSVISQMVVGPYQTVQLSSTTPGALTSWLMTNGYAIPSDIAPVLAAYVNDGFDFLALKLVPGAGISAMRPVSVTTPGANLTLPLRMVAAGAGATLPITLFVLGEGAYTPTNFPSFTIDPSKVVWDFNAETSNYPTLEAQAFAAQPSGWLVEYAEPTSEGVITNAIDALVQYDPAQSGYGDSMGNGAPAAAAADLATLLDGIDVNSFFITRLFAQMPRTALSSDLTMGASASQAPVSNAITADTYVNCAPGCGEGGEGAGGSGFGGAGGAGGSGAGKSGGSGASANGPGSAGGCSSCAVGQAGDGGLALAAVAALMLAMGRRRR